MKNDPFHQIVSVSIELDREYLPGEINRILKELGATLNYDVYCFERDEKGPIWQSECYVYIALFKNGKEVFAQEPVDKIELKYPMATIGSEYISNYVDIVTKLSFIFNTKPIMNGILIDKSYLISHCEDLVTELMDEWGEEPGSKSLRIIIEQNHG